MTSLFFAAALIVFAMPGSIYDVGLWLSFLATLGILVIYPLISTLVVAKKTGNGTKLCAFPRMILRYVLTAAAVTFSANILIIALSAFVLRFSAVGSCKYAVSPWYSVSDSDPFCPDFRWNSVYRFCIFRLCVTNCRAIVNITRTLSECLSVLFAWFAFARIIVILMSAAFAVLLVVDLKNVNVLYLLALGVCAYVCFPSGTANKDKISVHFAVEENETLM